MNAEPRRGEVAAAAGSSTTAVVMGPPQMRPVAPLGIPDAPGFPQPPTATTVHEFYQPEWQGDGTMANLQVYQQVSTLVRLKRNYADVEQGGTMQMQRPSRCGTMQKLEFTLAEVNVGDVSTCSICGHRVVQWNYLE